MPMYNLQEEYWKAYDNHKARRNAYLILAKNASIPWKIEFYIEKANLEQEFMNLLEKDICKIPD